LGIAVEYRFRGWVRTFEEAENVRRVFQAETSLTFVSGKKEAQFGRSEISNLVISTLGHKQKL
jgi:hypothetical protein